jgi:3-polyprenyl-4-hydroxybenzoate decarboxylase
MLSQYARPKKYGMQLAVQEMQQPEVWFPMQLVIGLDAWIVLMTICNIKKTIDQTLLAGRVEPAIKGGAGGEGTKRVH